MPKLSRALLLITSFVILTALVYLIVPFPDSPRAVPGQFGIDWYNSFQPSTILLFSGQNPYAWYTQVFNPTWTFIPFLPLALLPLRMGAAIMFMVNLLAFGFIAYKLKASPIAFALLLLSPPVLESAFQGQIDWLVPLGLLFTPAIGIFFVLTKPQIGIFIALFWIIEAWRSGGLKKVIKLILPVYLVLAFSFVIYGVYFLDASKLLNAWWDFSLWPYAIPVGAWLIYRMIRKRKPDYALLAPPFLVPYFAPYSYSVPLMAFLKSDKAMFMVVIAMWILQFLGIKFIGISFS